MLLMHSALPNNEHEAQASVTGWWINQGHFWT